MHLDLLTRPSRHTVLREHESVIQADADAVFVAVAAAVDPGAVGHFAADPQSRRIVVQGGWWYRAEYAVRVDPAGARLVFTLLNVASPAHWAGPITGRAVVRSSARDFGDLVARIRASL